MIVDSHNIEFGYELLSAIPHAYDLYLKGELSGTISGPDSGPLYYFSPSHKINKAPRSWFNTEAARNNGLPYTVIHKPEQPEKQFPPYKEIYANEEFKWEKPTLCICNRYNIEWSTKPINFFDPEILDWMFSHLKDQYEIIYFAVDLPEELQDNARSMHLEDVSVARKHGIKIFTDLKGSKSWNDTLLKVFANCSHYITMNGGYSILASMFSGTNIIYSKPGEPETREIKTKSFWRWYPNINNVRTLHVPSYADLKTKIQSLYIDLDPCLNILIRTFRPNYLIKCMESVNQQSYPNINVVFICDSSAGVIGTREHNGRMVVVEKGAELAPKPEGEAYGKFFPYNSYLDHVQGLIQGYILCLDDDDMITDKDSVKIIMDHVKEDKLTVWKVSFNGQGVIPSHSFRKSVTLFDISGIGICYHSSQIHLTDWSPWKRADYRTAKNLSNNLKTIWIDKILTSLQDSPGRGIKQDLPPKPLEIKYKITYPNGGTLIQCFSDAELKQCEEPFKRQGICIDRQT